MTDLTIARSELILGGQKSGKSRRAELIARDWLACSPVHSAVLVATAYSTTLLALLVVFPQIVTAPVLWMR